MERAQCSEIKQMIEGFLKLGKVEFKVIIFIFFNAHNLKKRSNDKFEEELNCTHMRVLEQEDYEFTRS